MGWIVYRKDGTSVGPLDLAEIRRHIKDGSLDLFDEGENIRTQERRRLWELEELFASDSQGTRILAPPKEISETPPATPAETVVLKPEALKEPASSPPPINPKVIPFPTAVSTHVVSSQRVSSYPPPPSQSQKKKQSSSLGIFALVFAALAAGFWLSWEKRSLEEILRVFSILIKDEGKPSPKIISGTSSTVETVILEESPLPPSPVPLSSSSSSPSQPPPLTSISVSPPISSPPSSVQQKPIPSASVTAAASLSIAQGRAGGGDEITIGPLMFEAKDLAVCEVKCFLPVRDTEGSEAELLFFKAAHFSKFIGRTRSLVVRGRFQEGGRTFFVSAVQ